MEDVVIHKLVAGRPRDIEDARHILSLQETIDDTYVRRWLKQRDYDSQSLIEIVFNEGIIDSLSNLMRFVQDKSSALLAEPLVSLMT